MREERSTTKMIKNSLYVEFASPRHYLICLSLPGMFVEMRDTRKGGVGVRPGGEEKTKTSEDSFIVSK